MTDWRTSAACRGRDPRLWFAVPAVDPVAAGVAARICQSCPVRVDCAGEAVRLAHEDPPLFGTWAGVTLTGAWVRAPVRRLEHLAGGHMAGVAFNQGGQNRDRP
jgi:hypothetical protein